MRTIRWEKLLLEEILKEIVENEGIECTLFGKKNYVGMKGENYDFVFHSILGIPLEKFKPEPFLIIPILSYDYPEDSDQAKLSMYEIHKNNPTLKTFAIRDEKSKIVTPSEDKKKRIETKSLKFFDLKRIDEGTEIVSRNHYFTINERKFRDVFPNWREVNIYLSKLRSEINRTYIDSNPIL